MGRSNRDCREASECRSCKALILWGQWLKTGKRMPIDVTPDPQGTVVAVYRARENLLLWEKFDGGNPEHVAGRKRYTSHFATCPNASQHRR